jgi:hypothetical protein
MLLAAQSSTHDQPAGVLFNAIGQRVPDGNIKQLRSGIYFLMTEDPPTVRKYVISR